MKSCAPKEIFSVIFATLLSMAILPLTAQITVVNETGGQRPDQGSPADDLETTPFTVTFNAGATADKLVVTLSSEGGNIAAISYDGDALTQIPDTFNGRNRGIWYLDFSTTDYAGGDADLTFDLTANGNVNGIGYGVVSIAGSLDGYAVSAVTAGDSTSVDLTPTATTSFVVTSYGANGNNNVTTPAGHTQLYGGDIGSARGAASYDADVPAGLNTFTWGGTVPGSADPRTSAAAFAPTNPLLVSTSPADNAGGVAVDTNLTAAFDKDVQAGTGFITLKRTSDDSTVESFDVTSQVAFSGAGITIDPASDLGIEGYYVTIDSTAIEDLAGNPFAGIADTTSWSFTTESLSLLNTDSFIAKNPSTTETGSFDAGAIADMVVVGLSSEKSAEAYTVTYDGNAMTLAIAGSTGSGADIWYLDLSGTSYAGGDADLVVDMSGVGTRNGLGVAMLSLSSGGQPIQLEAAAKSVAGTHDEVTLTTTAANSFVVASFNSNNTSGTQVSVDAPLTEIYASNDIGSARGAAGYESSVAAGSHTYSWTVPDGLRSSVAAAFSVNTGGDTTPPTLVSIGDNVSGGPITVGDSVSYTVDFDEAINPATVGTDDFENSAGAGITVDSATPTGDASVFIVMVTATSAGDLNLQIKSGAVIEDTSGNALDTTSPLPDDTTITVETAFEAWATGGETFDGDANGDGVQDGIAFLLGAATPATDALGLLPVVSESSGDLVLTFSCLPVADRGGATLEVEHSSDLGVGDAWTGASVPDASAGPTSGVTFLVTPGSPTNAVVATIGSAEASGGKLFGRLNGSE